MRSNPSNSNNSNSNANNMPNNSMPNNETMSNNSMPNNETMSNNSMSNNDTMSNNGMSNNDTMSNNGMSNNSTMSNNDSMMDSGKGNFGNPMFDGLNATNAAEMTGNMAGTMTMAGNNTDMAGNSSFTPENFTSDVVEENDFATGMFDNMPPNFLPDGNSGNGGAAPMSSMTNMVMDENTMAMSGSMTGNMTDGLNAEEVEAFWRNGFAGPFPLSNPANELAELANRYERVVLERMEMPLYGRYSLRDWHLVDKDLEMLFTQEAITNKLMSLLGPDLLMWRSKIFYKPSGGDAIGWHQEWGAFDGEEIGNSTPSLMPADNTNGMAWDLTVWVALDDVTPENGPLQFASGSNTFRVPWVKVPMTQSAFFEEPFAGLDKDEIVRRTMRNELVLDIETASWLDGVDVNNMSLESMTNFLRGRFDNMLAKFTSFDPNPNDVATMMMSRGSFVIFSERTMHGSPANNSNMRRMAVNCRVTRADTLVYPGRLDGNFVDGSNLNVQQHQSLLIAGNALENRNAWRRPTT